LTENKLDTEDKLTSAEVDLCYKKARKKLSFEDRVILDMNTENLAMSLPKVYGKPMSLYLRMEIIAKLGQWLNREHPIEEK